MLGLRLLTGFVGAPILIGLAVVGGIWYLVGVLAAVTAGTLELYGMLHTAGHRPIIPVGLAIALVFVLDATAPEYRLLPPALAIGAAGSLTWLMLRGEPTDALLDWATTLAPALYVGGLLQFFVPLRALPDGAVWAAAVLICTFACDIAAFFAGRQFGRTKLAAQISPGKSVEGAISGIVAAVAVGAILGAIVGQSPFRLAFFGLTVGVCAVLGDLLESFVKRQCGAKDSSNLVPGHGGVLDRMDSLLLSVAGGYFYLVATG